MAQCPPPYASAYTISHLFVGSCSELSSCATRKRNLPHHNVCWHCKVIGRRKQHEFSYFFVLWPPNESATSLSDSKSSLSKQCWWSISNVWFKLVMASRGYSVPRSEITLLSHRLPYDYIDAILSALSIRSALRSGVSRDATRRHVRRFSKAFVFLLTMYIIICTRAYNLSVAQNHGVCGWHCYVALWVTWRLVLL